MIELKKCAACRKEKPANEMRVCMHHQMHRYVCDSKCMHDFYNPFEKPDSEIDTLRTANQRLREALTTAKYRIEQGRVWNGMGWTLTGLHSHGQQQALDAIEAALSTANGEVKE